jgi:hypothetical protein
LQTGREADAASLNSLEKRGIERGPRLSHPLRVKVLGVGESCAGP